MLCMDMSETGDWVMDWVTVHAAQLLLETGKYAHIISPLTTPFDMHRLCTTHPQDMG